MQEHIPEGTELMEKAARYLPAAYTGNTNLGLEHPLVLREGRAPGRGM